MMGIKQKQMCSEVTQYVNLKIISSPTIPNLNLLLKLLMLEAHLLSNYIDVKDSLRHPRDV